MPTQVQGPDGAIIEFPDGVSPQEMQRAMQAHYQPDSGKLTRDYWSASATGDEQTKSAILRQAAAQGIRIGGPEQAQKDQMDAANAQSVVGQQSFGQNAVQGFGKSFSDTGQGLKQIGAGIADFVNPLPQTTVGLISGQQPSRYQQVTQQIDSEQPAATALNRTGGGLLGQVAGGVTQMALPTGAVTDVANATRLGRVGLQAGIGAAYAGAQPVPTGGSRLANTAFGAVAGGAGQAIPETAAVLASTPAAAAGKQYLAQLADQYGIPVRLAQLSNNPLVQAISSMANKFPGSGGQAANQAQREAVNRAVSQTFGENTPAITSETYNNAIDRIGGVFNDLTKRNNMQVDMPLLQKLVSIQNEAKSIGAPDSQLIDTAMQRIEDSVQNGVLPGPAYQKLDTFIGKNAGASGNLARDFRNALRTQMDVSINPADQAAWRLARSQYGNLKTVRDLISKDTGEGINPQGLMGRVTANDAGKEMMARGTRGDLGNIAKVSSGLLKDQIPDSGTITRGLAASALGGGGYFAAGPAGLAVLPIGALAGRVANSNALAQLARRSPAAMNRLATLTKGLPYLAAPTAVEATQ